MHYFCNIKDLVEHKLFPAIAAEDGCSPILNLKFNAIHELFKSWKKQHQINSPSRCEDIQ